MSDLLSTLLEDFHQRRARGETPGPEEYRERAGESYPDFLDLLSAESAIDAVMELSTEPPLPRPFGSYTLLRELGRGAFGVVYEALQRGLGRTVALKVLRTGFDTTPDAIERFKREAVACAQVRHAHVVEVYEAGENEGRPFYAMTKLNGRSLSQLARDGALPPPRELCQGLAGIADALHALHEKGIVHRDVKPGNIMVEPDGRMVLADFGLARAVASKQLTQSGEALGTPLYMSPEQLLGQREEINGRSDVYGLGATMYEVLAGRPVFRATDLRELMRMILDSRPSSLRDAAPTLDSDCESIVMKALEKRNRDRYGSAADMRDDLRAYAEGREVSGRPISGAVRALRRLRARWMPLTAAAAALLVAVLLWGRRAATLEVGSYPPAQVAVDGEERGETPLRLELPPGKHTLVLRTGGFSPQSREIELDAGQRRTLDLVLIAENPSDPEALAKLAKGFELAMANLDEMERHRGAGDDAGVLPLFPRGEVRLEDLHSYRIDVGPAFEAAGTLEWTVGGATVHSAPFDPEKLETVAEIPAEVKAALKRGSRASWGFVPAGKGKKTVTEFEVVEPDLDRRMEAIAKRLKDQPPIVLQHMRAQVYLDKGLHCAAMHEARDILGKVERSEHACAILQAALRAMKLTESPLWDDLQGRAAALPRKDRRERAGR